MRMNKREKQFFDLMKKQRIKCIFIPGLKFFKTSVGKYTPDFFLPEENCFIEVVGSRQAYSLNRFKYEKFKEEFPKIKLKFLNPDGSLYKPGLRRDPSQSIIDKIKFFSDKRMCPICFSTYIVFRKISQTNWCRRCGTDFIIKLNTEKFQKEGKG